MKTKNFLSILETDEQKKNESKLDDTAIVYSSDQEKGINYGLTFLVTGMIILTLGILTLVAMSCIFWIEWMYIRDLLLFQNALLLHGWNKFQ